MAIPNTVGKTQTKLIPYFILDSNVEEIAGVRITKDHREKGIGLTEIEAMSYIASGTISTVDPAVELTAKNAVLIKDGIMSHPNADKKKEPAAEPQDEPATAAEAPGNTEAQDAPSAKRR